MNSSINNRVRDFFSGDDMAWDDITGRLYDRFLYKFTGKFNNLPPLQVQDVVTDWFTDFCIEVYEGRNLAEKIPDFMKLSVAEKAKLYVENCFKTTKFDLERGTPFEVWANISVYHAVVSSHRKKEHQHSRLDSPDTPEYDEEIDENALNNQISWKEFSDEELARLMEFFETIIKEILDEDEWRYFQIWRKEGPDPRGDIVKRIFKDEFKREVSDAFVSKLKESFLIKSCLALEEAVSDMQALNIFFRRFLKMKNATENFSPIMMELLWKTFFADQESVRVSQEKISPHLWKHRETLAQRKKIEEEILVEAHGFFRTKSPMPYFCKLVKRYSENRFGIKIRELFFGTGEIENE